MTAEQARATFVSQNQGVALLGTVLAWELPEGKTVPYTTLTMALRNAGLDEKTARPLHPRYAFSRAAHKLAENRYIDRIKEEPTKLTFQFTKKFLTDAGLDFQKETILVLDKDTGGVTADVPEIQQRAAEEIAKALENRTMADVTNITKRQFEKRGDLFPIKANGGVYYVPAAYDTLVDQVERFLTIIGGSLIKIPMPAGTREGDKTVAGAIQAGLEALVKEHAQAVSELSADNRMSTLERRLAKVDQTKFKLETYATFLDTSKEQLSGALDQLRVKLNTIKQEIILRGQE